MDGRWSGSTGAGGQGECSGCGFVRRSGKVQQCVRGSFCRRLWTRDSDFRGAQQVQPIRHIGALRPGSPAMQRQVGGTPPGGDLQARTSFRRLRKGKPASGNSCGDKSPRYGKMRKSFVIDSLPGCAARYANGYAVVAVDVIRATTMAITAVDAG